MRKSTKPFRRWLYIGHKLSNQHKIHPRIAYKVFPFGGVTSDVRRRKVKCDDVFVHQKRKRKALQPLRICRSVQLKIRKGITTSERKAVKHPINSYCCCARQCMDRWGINIYTDTIYEAIGCFAFTNSVGLENIRILLWNRRTPQPKANPTQEKKRWKVAVRPPFPQQIIFGGSGLILYRKQTRNPTEPNSPQPPFITRSR